MIPMDIKKHTFDVLNTEDMTRSFHGCLMRFNDSIIRLSEFFTGDGGAMSCTGQKIRCEPGVELLGREFRLGANQMRALADPDNLLPVIRSGHVNILDVYSGKMRGHYTFSRKVGGYVRGYGARSIHCYSADLDGSDAYYELSGVSDNDHSLRVLHSAFTGGNYASAAVAYEDLLTADPRASVALAPNILMQKYDDKIRVALTHASGSFICVKRDDGTVAADMTSNRTANPTSIRMYSRIISKVMPCL